MIRVAVSTGVDAGLVVGALVAATFFSGPETRYLVLALTLILAWLVRVVPQSHAGGLRIPCHRLALALALFWAWAGLSSLWSVVPPVSIYSFWWIGALPLVFFAYAMAPARAAIWRLVAVTVLVLGVALAVAGIVQVLVLKQAAQSLFRTQNTHAAVLNLVALPAAAYLLIALRAQRTRAQTFLLGACFFVLVLGVAETQGRGAILSFCLGLAVLIGAAAQPGYIRHALLLLALAAGAFLIANLSLEGGLGARVQTLFEPARAAVDRLVIWGPAWELVQQRPWLGSGLGTYYLVSPPVRHVADLSAGYYVHNDYLQIWLETGAVGLMLLLAGQLGALSLLVGLWRESRNVPARIEGAGLFAGLFAVAAHSLVDFNFFVLPILLLMGLMLGRLAELAAPAFGLRHVELQLAGVLGKTASTIVACLLALFALLYLVPQGITEYLRNQAWQYMASGDLQKAERALGRAGRLSPEDAQVLNTRAELYRHALSVVRGQAPLEERQALFERALEFSREAARLNPLRAVSFDIRARLYQENPDLAGEGWRTLAAEAYEQALARDPRLTGTREAYARMLWVAGEANAARHVAEQGVVYGYAPRPELAPLAASLLRFTAELRRIQGDAAGAQALEERAAKLAP